MPTTQRNAAELESLFNSLFLDAENTRLVGGAAEPVYLPADAQHDWHRLYYREDYFASALHEIAHWCIAGYERRQHLDFGYWYQPDGRDVYQQRSFEQVEIKPQALECLFTEAAGCRFVLSVDNLAGGVRPSAAFVAGVQAQVDAYRAGDMPARARVWLERLQQHYGAGVTQS